MNFTYDSSGSAQQILWAQNAIAACTYPLANININVGFFWVSALPTTVHGLLMLTQPQNDGSYKIFINNRADDPNASHLVGGLDNPPAQIQRFYMESVIHELGHVVHYNLLGSDTGKEDVVCGTLEIPQPLPTNGYRVGNHTDYAQDPPTILWADSVKEGIAEVFKDMTYNQRVYDNRSNWKLVFDSVGQFGTALAPPSAVGGGLVDTFPNPDPYYGAYYFHGQPLINPSGGLLLLDTASPWGFPPNILDARTLITTPFSLITGELLIKIEEPTGPNWDFTIALSGLDKVQFDNFIVTGTNAPPYVGGGSGDAFLRLMGGDATSITSTHPELVAGTNLNHGIVQVTDSPGWAPFSYGDEQKTKSSWFTPTTWPLWFRLIIGDTTNTAEVWYSDPDSGGGSADLSISTTRFGTPQLLLNYGVIAATGFGSDINGPSTITAQDVDTGISYLFETFRTNAGNYQVNLSEMRLRPLLTTPGVWTPGWPYADSQVALGDHNSAILRMKNQLASSKLALTTR